MATRRKKTSPVEEPAVADPVISTESVQAESSDGGTHPARPVSEVSHNADRIEYRDNPDKPDESTVAQLADIPDDFPLQAGRSDQE